MGSTHDATRKSVRPCMAVVDMCKKKDEFLVDYNRLDYLKVKRWYCRDGWDSGQGHGTLETFIHPYSIMRRTSFQASHDSTMSTVHPRRFKPW
jgi:hypothetical protein